MESSSSDEKPVMKIVLASGNQHKYEEILAVLPRNIQLVLQSELGIDSPPETGTTFIENALIKAKHGCEISGLPTLADDSGLCVSALAGQPGVRSARFAGAAASDQDNNLKLLQALQGVIHRSASFHCVLVFLLSPSDPAPLISHGIWQGEISDIAKGTNGFGYDPLFLIPGLAKTSAEVEPQEKNLISHRGQALAQMETALRGHYPT